MTVKLLDLQAQYLPIRNEIRRAIDEVCDSQALILGPHVERFEEHLAEYCGTKHAIGVSQRDGRAAVQPDGARRRARRRGDLPQLHLLRDRRLDRAAGGQAGLRRDRPRAPSTSTPTGSRSGVTPKTKAIMPVHLFGQTGATWTAINEIADKHGLPVIEDAAQAIGAKRHGKPACAMGFAGCLSFYPTKNLGAFGDAGAICTNDDAFAEHCRKLRVHGSGHTYHHEHDRRHVPPGGDPGGGAGREAEVPRTAGTRAAGERRDLRRAASTTATRSSPRTSRRATGASTTSTSSACRDRDRVEAAPRRPRHRHRRLLPPPAAPAGVLRLPRPQGRRPPRHRTSLPRSAGPARSTRNCPKSRSDTSRRSCWRRSPDARLVSTA